MTESAATHHIHRVLLVESDEALRSAIRRALRAPGREIVEADTFAAGLALLDTGFNLVVLDVLLPDGSGVDFATAASGRLPARRVLVLSGEATAQEALLLARLGVVQIVSNPFSLDELLLAFERIAVTDIRLEAIVRAYVGTHDMRDVQDDVRNTMVDEALVRTGGNRAEAAKLLRVTRQAVQNFARLRRRTADSTSGTANRGPTPFRNGPAVASLLMIDDEASLCRSLTRLLRRHGIEVSAYTDPDLFMAAAASHAHTAVLADWNLRSCEGNELLARRRAAGDTRPMALFSGRLTDAHGWEVARAAGADLYICKSMEPAQLAIELAALCALPESPRARAPGRPPGRGPAPAGTARGLRVVDYRLVRGSVSLPLTVHLRKLVLLLMRVRGAVVDHATIAEEIYGHRTVDEAVRHRIWQLVHVLRVKGRELGFTIRSARGQGYELEEVT